VSRTFGGTGLSALKEPASPCRFGAEPFLQAGPGQAGLTTSYWPARHGVERQVLKRRDALGGRGRMGSIMDRRSRRAPDAEWVLMYRLGLSRQRIAALVRAEPGAVGYHLAVARRQDPGLEAEHQAAAGAAPVLYPSPKDLARMEQVVTWVSVEGRLPNGHSADRGERAMARWLSRRRRESAEGNLDPTYSSGLSRVPGWLENRREVEDEARWHHRLAQLVDFREEGNDWPRHRKTDSDREHSLRVWIHTQRYKRRRGELDLRKLKLLDEAVPGWQAGRTRGRPPRQ
jgi:hypothetical protein